MAVTENPNRKGMIFAGTGHGLYYTLDDGAHWRQFKEGLPQTAVSWIIVHKTWHDLIVSTYGRGVFILRDIAPLELEGQIADADVQLYPPHPGYRQARSGRADITFNLKTCLLYTSDAADERSSVDLGGRRIIKKKKKKK